MNRVCEVYIIAGSSYRSNVVFKIKKKIYLKRDNVCEGHCVCDPILISREEGKCPASTSRKKGWSHDRVEWAELTG